MLFSKSNENTVVPIYTSEVTIAAGLGVLKNGASVIIIP